MSTPFAKSHIRRFANTQIRRPHAASQPYYPADLLKAYNWPTGTAVTPLTIVIGELGGKFYPADLAEWSAKTGFAAPTVKTHLLPGADDSSSDADGEVALDWQLAAAVWSYMTGTPANILIVYGPNSGQAFADCQDYASQTLGLKVGAFSWSWGSPEDQWNASDRTAVDSSAQSCPFPITAASGDNLANDGEGSPTTDFPSCSPYITGCGGTSKPLGGPETVWNDGPGEGTGGGFSKFYPRPSYQLPNSQGTMLMDPDLAANADPATGWMVLINGQWEPIGGTSAVAPLIAGLFCVINGARVKIGMPMIAQMNPLLWSNTGSFLDITSGNNSGFNATVGPDPCTGLGRPLGTLVSALVSGSTPPGGGPPGGGGGTPPSAKLFTLNFTRAVPAGRKVQFTAPVNIPVGKDDVVPEQTAAVEAHEVE